MEWIVDSVEAERGTSHHITSHQRRSGVDVMGIGRYLVRVRVRIRVRVQVGVRVRRISPFRCTYHFSAVRLYMALHAMRRHLKAIWL